MNAKRFSHFHSFWQQFTRLQTGSAKSPTRRRVTAAKATLRSALASR